MKEELFLEKLYGRIRDICVSPDGDIYICTSNHDWNPMTSPAERDDRILRISKVDKATKTPLKANDLYPEVAGKAGEILYQKFCFSCHKDKGLGLENIYPALKNSPIVADSDKLLHTVLKGAKNEEYAMPAFGFLSDTELFEIVNYLRTTINNHQDAIDLDDIAAARKK